MMHRLRAYIAATRALYASIPNPPGYESPFAAGRFTLAQHRRAVALGFEQYKASWRPEPSAAAETDGDESSSSSAALSAADADAEDGAALRDAARDVARDGVAFAQETAREKVAEVREMDVKQFAQEQVDLYSSVITEFSDAYKEARDDAEDEAEAAAVAAAKEPREPKSRGGASD